MMTLERVKWFGKFKLEKFYADGYDALIKPKPYEVVHAENLLLTAGATAICQRLCGQGTVQVFDATNTYISIGNSAATVAASQTELQGAIRVRKLVDSVPTISAGVITVVSTFGTADANQSWQEIGVANTATPGTGLLLNRVVQDFGTKTSGLIWVLTGSLGFA